jgi:hypothetical protein
MNMNLSPENTKLFFDLMWSLQFYVNRKHGFHKGIATMKEYAVLDTKKKLKARDALWKSPGIIDEYVEDNPDRLPADELQIIEKWKRAVTGSFFILRHLKKGSIFIGRDDKVYSVQGIHQPLDEIIPSDALPQMVEAVLLPFKGKIVYDGLLSGYNIHFGSGFRSNFNQTYAFAKQKNQIITTLEPELDQPQKVKPVKNILPQLEEIAGILEKIKGGNPLQNSALHLARLCVEMTALDHRASFAPNDAAAEGRKISKAARRLLNQLEILSE